MSAELWKSIFDWSTVVLAALTFVALGGAVITGNILNSHQEKELALLKKNAGEAVEKAGKVENANLTLRGQVATLETEAAKQQERAAKAEKALLDVQRTLADRQLSDEQVERIVQALRPFSGQEYGVTPYWDSKESSNIAERINQTLQKAGWRLLQPTGYHSLLGGLVGILVWRHPEADEQTKAAAVALVAALSNAGLHTELRIENPTNNPKHNKINLSVGSKR